MNTDVHTGVTALKKLIPFVILFLFLASGCAHKQAAQSSGPVDSSERMKKEQPPASSETDREYKEDDIDYSETEEVFLVADPLYPWNFAMFHFNDKLYFWLLKPVATGYEFIVPRFMRVAVKDFFHNLTTPVRLVNSLLQGKILGAGRELSRFVVNTTVGVLGFWDPALDLIELEPCEEDFGQTLGSYGIGNGFYIVWPVLGPSTLRDTFGTLGDTLLNPVTYVDPWWIGTSITGFRTINETSLRLGEYEDFKRISFDPYTALQDGYVQDRRSKIKE